LRSDTYAYASARKRPLDSYSSRRSPSAIILYDMGDYVPGKDEYLELCEECPFEECIRTEGDFSPYRPSAKGVRDYPGCPVWEAGKEVYEERYGSKTAK